MSVALEELSFNDSVDKIDIITQFNNLCIETIHKCTEHFKQFPTEALQVDVEYKQIKEYWLLHYTDLNQENKTADLFSECDLMFVCICYMELARNPSWRFCCENDQQLDQVIEVIRYIGSQHTPDTMNTWIDPTALQHITQNVAWIIVNKLSSRMVGWSEEQDQKMKLIQEKKYTKKIEHLSYITSEMYEKLEKLKTFAEPPKTSEGKFIREMQWGEFFTQSNVSGLFMKLSSRVLHGIEFENYVLSLYPIDTVKPDLGNDVIKTQMYTWLERSCKLETSDDFAHDFRTAIFDNCLPVNSSIEALSRKGNVTAKIIPMTQLQNEVGYEIASELNSSFGLRVRDIGFKKEHPYYQFIMLYVFGYTCFHEQRVSFINTFYIPQSKIMSSLTLLKTKKRFHRNREPLIVRIQRKWFIHYIHSENNVARWMPCDDAIEACLFWLWLLKEHHECNLISGHMLKSWIDKFLSVRDFDFEDE